MRRNHRGLSRIILRRRCVPLRQGRRCWWRKRRTTILGRHFGSNPAHSLSPRTSLPSLSLSLTHTHTLVQPCSSAQEQESSSKAKPKSFSHIKRERQFITERESLKNSWSFFRVLQRERSSVWVWESVNLIMVLIRLLRRGMRWFELQKHPDRWIDSVIVRSGARCGPHVWHVSFSMFELSSVYIKKIEFGCPSLTNEVTPPRIKSPVIVSNVTDRQVRFWVFEFEFKVQTVIGSVLSNLANTEYILTSQSYTHT